MTTAFVPIASLPLLPGAPSSGNLLVVQAVGITYKVDVRSFPLSTDTFLTWVGQSGNLPNSRLMIAGTGITFDATVDNELTISSSVVAPVAHDPTASIGLAAVVGVATTYMRSDAAPPLDVAIAPVWTGTHEFKGSMPTGFAVSYASLGTLAAGQFPGVTIVAAGATATNKRVTLYLEETTGAFNLALFTDAGAYAANILSATRNAANVVAMTYGSDTATIHNFSGKIAITAPFNTIGLNMIASGNGGALAAIQNLDAGALANAALSVGNGAEGFTFLITGTGFVGAKLTDGPAGTAAYVYTNTAKDVVLGTNLIARLLISGATGAVSVNDASTFRQVGYRELPYASITGSRVLSDVDAGKAVYYHGAGGHTITGFAAPAGTIVTVVNQGAGTLTIAPGSGTLYWLAGTGAPATGNRTLAIGGICTMWFDGADVRVWGVGLT